MTDWVQVEDRVQVKQGRKWVDGRVIVERTVTYETREGETLNHHSATVELENGDRVEIQHPDQQLLVEGHEDWRRAK